MQKHHRAKITGLAGLLGLLGLVAVAVQAAPEHRIVPYQGHLELHGQPVNHPVNMVVNFYNQASGGAAIDGAEVQLSGVPVYEGDFSIQLTLSPAVLATDPIYIGLSVDGVGLVGRQRIFAVPFAMRGRGDGVFTADQQVSSPHVETQSVNTQSLTTWSLSTASLEQRGSDFLLGTDDGRSTGSQTNQRALTHYDNDELVINFAGDFEGGTRVQSDLTVTGNLRTNGSLQVDGNVTGTLNAKHSALCDCVDIGGSAIFEGQGWYECPDAKVLTGMYHSDCDQLHCIETFRCCRVCDFVSK